MRILFVTSEAAPIVKFGGLGDFSGSLPKALEKIDVDVDVILPYYSNANVEHLKLIKALSLVVPYNFHAHTVEFYKTKLPGSDVSAILIKSPAVFNGNFITDTEFFAFFDRCVVEYIKSQYNSYDLIHCNDWHTGFITHLLQDELGSDRPKTLTTIHNLAYQGIGSSDIAREVGFTPGSHRAVDWDIEDGNINMLLQGLIASDWINTVSPSYATEILQPEFGGEFTDLLNQRSSKLAGILNGIDYTQFPRTFDKTNWLHGKRKAKELLYKTLSLEVTDAPLFAFISRIDPNQKGLDILYESLDALITSGGRFLLLGTGDPSWEEKFKNLESDNIHIHIGFDANLALRIYEASDFFLVPSKYEPCGLTQMISMWYASIPIAHAVGGLKDSILDGKNGFLFNHYTSEALSGAYERAFALHANSQKYEDMCENCLNTDFSWKHSAQEYKKLYRQIHG